MTPLGSPVGVPAGWFSNNAGPAANTSLTGLMDSQGAAPQMAFVYDFFRIDRNVPPPGGGSGAPAQPGSPSPANGATSVATTTALSWGAAANATSYDVAFGTTTPPPVVSTGQTGTSFQPSTALSAGTTYFWQVTAKGAGGTTAGPVWSFTTATTASGPGEIVIYASDVPAAALHGGWTTASDPASPNSLKLSTADAGINSNNAPLASPAEYVDVTFNAVANTPYRIWLRLQALNNSRLNDSVWVQFSDAFDGGSQVCPINSTSGLLVNLATDNTNKSLLGWGWQNGAYWLSQATTVTFPTSGPHTIRIQIREDGVQLDQIVLSPSKYLNAAPGPVTNDHTIVPKS